MKTGFICSAGFNVVASATRNGRHLITVVIGAPSANERTMKAAELFDRGFSTSPPGRARLSPHCRHRPRPRLPICARLSATVGVPCPNEEDSATTLATEQGGGVPNLFSSDMLAFAGGAQPLRTEFGPRSAVQPERVWVGLNPPSEARLRRRPPKEAAAAAKAREAKSQKSKSKNAKGKVDADTVAETDDKPEVDKVESKGKARATISVKPVTDKAKAPVTKQAAAKDPAKDASKPADSAAKPKPAENRRSGESQAGGELSGHATIDVI